VIRRVEIREVGMVCGRDGRNTDGSSKEWKE
jgi:hypothetical protein